MTERETNLPQTRLLNKELEEPQQVENFAITFCDQAESGGFGMPNAGEMVHPGEGYTLADLQRIQASFPGHPHKLINIRTELLRGVTGTDAKSVVIREMVEAQPSAYLLVVRGGGRTMLAGDTRPMLTQLLALPWDKKKGPKKKGGVPQNKHDRYNIAFGHSATAPNYSIGQSTVIAYNDPRASEVSTVNTRLEQITGHCLVAEGNFYHKENSGIRYHGDTTRRRVIGVRFGASRRLHFQHFLKFMPVGANGAVDVRDGDLYVFSEHAAGTDWKSSAKLTLRHAAGVGHWTVEDGKKLWAVRNFGRVRDSKPHEFEHVGDAIWTPPTAMAAWRNYLRRKAKFEEFVART